MRTSEDWWNDRKTRGWRDQHGRVWDVTLDKDSWAPVTPPIPRFRAPLPVPLEFLKPNAVLDQSIDDLGFDTTPRLPTSDLVIDYAAWEENWHRAELRYFERKRELMRRGFRDEELLLEAGPLPESPEFVRAAHAGNRWVLGIPHPDPTKRYGVPPLLQPLVAAGRLAPRATRDTDLDTAPTLGARDRYADVIEDATTPDVVISRGPSADALFGDTVEDAADALAPSFTAPDGVDFEDDDDDMDFGGEADAPTDAPTVTVATRRRGRPSRG